MLTESMCEHPQLQYLENDQMGVPSSLIMILNSLQNLFEDCKSIYFVAQTIFLKISLFVTILDAFCCVLHLDHTHGQDSEPHCGFFELSAEEGERCEQCGRSSTG